MKDFHGTLADLEDSCQRKVSEVLSSPAKKSDCWTSEGLSLYTPNAVKENPERVSFLSRSYNSLVTYLIILHCTEQTNAWWFVRSEIVDFIRDIPEFFWFEVLLDHELFFEYLRLQYYHSARWLFGTILSKNNIVKVLRSIKFNFRRQIRPRRTIRRRGYNDKGSRPSADSLARRQEEQRDIVLQELQNRKESLEQSHAQDLILFSNFLRGVGLLSKDQLCKFYLRKRGKKYDERTGTVTYSKDQFEQEKLGGYEEEGRKPAEEHRSTGSQDFQSGEDAELRELMSQYTQLREQMKYL